MTRSLGPPVYLDPDPAVNGIVGEMPDGRVFADVTPVLVPEQIEQIRQGYRCIRCHEPQSQAWPERCESVLPNGTPWCWFPIAERQAQAFAVEYEGEVKLGSSINLADEQARLDEIVEYEERTGIVLPDAVKFPQGKI